ncbi:hypothetical protein PYW08_011595 [Mythimna loreyi]|uniref:Uncharacterized protein n=1 Tax=Mythimna loreyi TaxID=667449 RepID=A0ACC2QMG3_9NEOP|nr:hypothetical protein PYW08_011595 [Mythimna loreyi]
MKLKSRIKFVRKVNLQFQNRKGYKMRTKLPVCKRCCFCLPLRYSLLTWGYIRLGLSTHLIITLSMVFYWMIERVLTEGVPLDIAHTAILATVLLLLITDIVLNTVFVTGGHKKDTKLLRVYYIYSFILCTLLFLLWIASVIATLYRFRIGEIEATFYIYIILVDSATLLALVFAQIFVLLLVRSEIIKLRSHCEFRYVNNAAEAECTLDCEELNGEEEQEYTYERYVSEEYKLQKI